jgi:hypothetical protein
MDRAVIREATGGAHTLKECSVGRQRPEDLREALISRPEAGFNVSIPDSHWGYLDCFLKSGLSALCQAQLSFNTDTLC